MTKKEERNLTWKLGELPTAGELAELVEAEVITKEEAREIMFGSAESDKDKVEALEKMVEFLQGLVTDLAKQRNTTTYIPYTRTIEYTPKPYFEKVWMNTAKSLESSGINLSSSVIGSTSYAGSENGKFYSNSNDIVQLCAVTQDNTVS